MSNKIYMTIFLNTEFLSLHGSLQQPQNVLFMCRCVSYGFSHVYNWDAYDNQVA